MNSAGHFPAFWCSSQPGTATHLSTHPIHRLRCLCFGEFIDKLEEVGAAQYTAEMIRDSDMATFSPLSRQQHLHPHPHRHYFYSMEQGARKQACEFDSTGTLVSVKQLLEHPK